MAEIKMLTTSDLAEKAGLTPAELRKLLRKEFNRAGKVKVEKNRMEYRFASNDPVVKQIIQKAKAQTAEKVKEDKPIEKKPKAEKVEEKQTDQDAEVKNDDK